MSSELLLQAVALGLLLSQAKQDAACAAMRAALNCNEETVADTDYPAAEILRATDAALAADAGRALLERDYRNENGKAMTEVARAALLDDDEDDDTSSDAAPVKAAP